MRGKEDILTAVRASGLCSGCGICESIAGRDRVCMELSEDGYLRPTVLADLDTDMVTEIEAVCPGIRLGHTKAENAIYDPTWGPILDVMTGHSMSEDERHSGASGGALSALLTSMLESGAVAYVLHIGADPDDILKTRIVRSRTRADVLEATGSRYAPSAPLRNIVAEMEAQGTAAVVGKPCDIAALRTWMERSPDANDKFPYLISFFCAGVPSIKGTQEILAALGLDQNEVQSVRYRGQGWPGKFRARVKGQNDRTMSYADSWGKFLSNRLQFRCKICPDGTGEFADVAFGDAWYGDEDGYPDFDEASGRSLILTRTEKGRELIAAAIDASALAVNGLEVPAIGAMQPFQRRRKQLTASRLLAMMTLGLRTPDYVNMELIKNMRQGGTLPNLRSYLGMIRRLIAGKAGRV